MGIVKLTHPLSREIQISRKDLKRSLDKLASEIGSKTLAERIIAMREQMIAKEIDDAFTKGGKA